MRKSSSENHRVAMNPSSSAIQMSNSQKLHKLDIENDDDDGTKESIHSSTQQHHQLHHACRQCSRSVLLLVSQVYWCCVDWSIIFMVFASSYWHLFNVYSLSFNIQTVIGLFLALLIVPSLFFIPYCQRLFHTLHGLLFSRLLSIVLLACGLQVQETVRTIFLALSAGCAFLRLITIPRTSEATSSPHMQCVYYTIGLLLVICLRSLFFSLHPLDVMNSAAIPICFLTVALVTAIVIFECAPLSHKVPSSNEILGVPGHWSIQSKLTVCVGIFGCIGTACVIFLGAYMMSSDAMIPRWSGYDPSTHGPIVVACLFLGCIIQILFVVFGHRIHPILDIIIRLIIFIIFVIGSALFMTARNQQSFASSSSPLGGWGYRQFNTKEGVPGAFWGGCLTMIAYPSISDVVVGMFRYYVVVTSSIWKRFGISILFGLWILFAFVFHLGWFVGSFLPVVGEAFWSNESGVLLWVTIPIFFAFLFGIGVRFTIHRQYQQSKNVTIQDEEEDEEDAGFYRSKPLAHWASHTHHHSHFVSSLILLFSIFVLLFLPSVRQRGYYHAQRGSRLITDQFSVVSHNIQMGLTLYNTKDNLGFPTTNRLEEFDALLHPNLWGLQESDSTNLLHMNRDFVSYFADHSRFHAYPGAPSYLSTPGVAFLSADKLESNWVTLLPRADEPLNRLVMVGSYPWRLSPGTDPIMTISVAVTHLSAFSALAREVQLNVLMITLPSTGPLVLMGDFNAKPEVIEPVITNGTKIKRVPLDVNSPTETAGWDHIDHIYYRDLCLERYGISSQFGISDHLPVWATFEKPDANGNCPT